MHSKNDALDPPIPEVEDKSIDPEEGMEKLQSGEIKMATTSWPTGFYEDSVYNPQDKTKGLFRNHVVAQFYAHLYIGPLAAMSESTSSKASKQARNRAFGLSSVMKHIIAIVHIIMYFTLSQAQNWTNEIGNMNLVELFWSIIDMLDDDEDPWVKDTMAWWMACIGSKAKAPTKKPECNEDDDDEENDIADIKAQRLARCGAMKSKIAGVPPAKKKLAPSLPPPSKTKCAQQVESNEDIEADEAPANKKKPAPSLPPPLKTKHAQQVESDEDIEANKAPSSKKKSAPSLPPPLKTKCAQQIESDEDIEADEAPPNMKKPAPSLAKKT
ncbi:hypothetical protein F4604DRAFT_1936861 [Suillus subluteus]|nr:hypothetical protein F4604DRAFT_1936861 [Suillus subluteus]